MNTNKTKPIVQGAMLASLYGVLAILNSYTGSIADIVLAYVMAIFMSWYAEQNNIKHTLSLLLTSAVVVFLAGNIWFTVLSIPTLLLGIYYGLSMRRKGKVQFFGLVVVSAIKNGITYFVFGGLLEVSIFEEGREIYQMFVDILPGFGNIIPMEVVFVLLWVLIFVMEAYCMYIYTYLFQKRVFKKK